MDCLPEAFQLCPAPEPSTAATLPEQDAEDTANRELWKVCILKHAAAVGCLKAGVEAGIINPPPKDP